ncbi:MAG: DUF1573 domain-containing protein [Crocinitomicaceae bacterium]|nr:DUF1573 domain-containing protein [Crocinitomicaceae bacterium]
MIARVLISLSFILVICNTRVQAQSFQQLMEFADQKSIEGDYYYAIQYYERAMQIDSNSVELLWKYAEALRKYKDYPKAEYYYAKVYKKEEARIYPMSIYWLATMQQMNGKYSLSLEHWKEAKKVYKKDREGYLYLKSQQQIKSCLWASKAVRDTSDYNLSHLPEPVNSKDSEFAPRFHQNKMYFTSLKADSINFSEEVYTADYSLQIYTVDQQDSMFNNLTRVSDVYIQGLHSANGTFSPDGKRFYFSRCNGDYECKIFVGKVEGDKITDIDSLGEIINEPGYISTMPHSTLINGEEVLFFCSTIKHNYGGLDIWYTIVKNGNQYSLPKNLGPTINTMDDDITPFYDTTTNRLYFSSSWHEGFGGQDIFYAENPNLDMQFSTPTNLGIPVNSAQNDTYLAVHPTTGKFYFSSNRVGVNFAKNPTCCNDIFIAALPEVIIPQGRFESLEDLNKKLPVVLYFHNDEPNPRSRDTVTGLNYMTTYREYIKLKPTYHKEYSAGLSGDDAEEAKEDIDDFFTQYVEQGVLDLQEFTRLLLIELNKGYDIEVTIKGFASPLAKTDYNVSLTKRRISSLVNYLREYGTGEFIPYLDGTASNGGSLTFVQIPFGEYTADILISDNVNDQKNSVYSRKAALERKIEIQSVSLVKKDSSYAEMKFLKEIHDFGASTKGQILSWEFTFTNTGDMDLIIDSLESDCPCFTYEMDKKILKPGESATIKVSLNTTTQSGLTVRRIKIYSNVKNKVKEISVTTEVK